jgi:hypothetical protein
MIVDSYVILLFRIETDGHGVTITVVTGSPLQQGTGNEAGCKNIVTGLQEAIRIVFIGMPHEMPKVQNAKILVILGTRHLVQNVQVWDNRLHGRYHPVNRCVILFVA